MRIRFGLVLTVYLAFSLPALGAAKDDSWENLRRVTWHRTYTFVDHESNCFAGQILTVADQSVTIKRPQAKNITVERQNTLRVTDGRHINDVIYSAKSSWADVEGILPKTKEGVRVRTTSGRKYDGKLASASDTSITLMHPGGNINLAKADITQVYYVRYKPLSEGAEHSAQEMFFVDPRLWPYFLNISAKIPVRLYDSSVPEDNAPVQCKNEP
jgi:hypothetical protein